MHIRLALTALAVLASLAACGGGGVSSTPVPSPTATALVLAAATSATCVTAQSTAQTVALPDTGGISATLVFAQYDAGATGCQNITIATGSAASAAATATSASRRALATSPAPIVSMTLGQGLPTSLGLATVMSGVTLNTDPNLNFPDGTYNATVTISAGGVPLTLSLVFTAANGKLTITGGTALPINLGGGAQLLIYDRGVVPPDFTAPGPTPNPSPTATTSATPSPAPSTSATPAPIPTPTALPTAASSAFVPDNTTIGSFNFTIGGLPNSVYGNGAQYNGTIVYTSQAVLNSLQCTTSQTSGNATCTYTANYFSADIPSGGGVLPGVMSYTLSGVPAKSYRIDGCTGGVTYGGSGTIGTFTTPYRTLVIGDNCAVDLFSQSASVVNATSDHGAEYQIYSVYGPVTQDLPTSSPAQDTAQSVSRSH